MRPWTEAGCRILLLASLAAALPDALHAQRQQAPADTAAARRLMERQTGRSMSQAEVLERIRASGMSRRELRARLQQMGYDPALVDTYYDVIEGGAELPGGAVSSPFLEALGRAGLTRPDKVSPWTRSAACPNPRPCGRRGAWRHRLASRRRDWAARPWR